ncbi:cache domain-containing sensor histidine kinase [Ectobacillus funiculus]|uniref:cache domain-containing sensor histidine kinase n=1 Tax=Ectobacillus funiculus TaxID=137993 RepID=UPI00101B7697|nr:sensor histidine kinase [Ectobacillus funiculus]
MSKRLLQNRFSTKVVIAIFIGILIPTTLISVFFFISSSNIVKENVRESSIQIARQAADSLSFILSVGNDMSDLIYSNEKLQEIVKMDNEDGTSSTVKDKNNEEMTSFLNSQIYSSSFVRVIYVLKDEGTSWGSGTFSPVKLARYNLQEQNWIQRAVQADGALAWQGLQYDLFSGAGENTELVLPVTRVMKDFSNMKNIAYIQVLLDGKAILNKIDQLKLGKTGHFFVVNKHGQIMIDANMEHINKTVENHDLYKHIVDDTAYEFEFQEKNTTYYGVKQPLVNGWTLIGTVPIKEITGKLTNIQRITIFASIVFTMVAIVVGVFAVNRVTKPIKVLTEQMRLVGQGNFQVQTHIHSNDEIGLMSRQFNQMIHQIEQLMEQVKEEQSQKTEAELRAVKHRINPHFLFNTLSTIRWLVNFKQTDRANTALSALIRLLEASMGKTGTFITVKEELDIIEKFLAILQIRYEQTFHLELEIEPTVEDLLIPRMLLQPIVENAVFHGLVPKGTEGTLCIKGSRVEDGVKIEIKDNGVGFKQDILNQLNHKADKMNSFIGIGLRHVYDSVRLYFALASSVTIESDSNGTTVTIVLINKNRGENRV